MVRFELKSQNHQEALETRRRLKRFQLKSFEIPMIILGQSAILQSLTVSRK